MKHCIILLFCLLIVPACSSDDPLAPTGLTGNDFDAVMDAAGKVVPPETERHDITTNEEVRDGNRYTYEMHDAVENLENVVYLGLNDDVIWPGNMVKGSEAQSYVYIPISAPRAPVTLSISLEGTGFSGSLSEEVTDPRLSTVRQGISTLVGRALDQHVSVPAQVDWSYEEVHSSSQMSMYVGADIGYGLGSLETAFDWNQQHSSTRIMAKYTQVYFSIDMDTPSDPRALFSPDITRADLARAIPPGSMPLYVASVKYGMMAIMCIETDYSSDQMSLSLDAAYSGAVDVEIEFGLTAREVLDSSSIRIIVYGGSTQGIQELNGLEAFMGIIAASTEFTRDSPGVPLVYKFRHIHDNTLALISLTSQYTIVRELQIEQWIRVNSLLFTCTWSDDDDPFYDDDVDIDDLRVYVSAWNRVDGNDNPGTPITEDEQAYGIHYTDYVEMHAGSTHSAQGAVDLVFNTEDFNWDNAHLRIRATAWDYDWASGNETSFGHIDLLGNFMLGSQAVILNGPDFTMRLDLLVEAINK